MSELKPCPFCGGEAEVRHSVTCGYDSYWVECKDFQNCRGSVSPVTDVESIAAAAWNTRHVETCSNERGRCSACGSIMYDAPNYCAICGRKVEG